MVRAGVVPVELTILRTEETSGESEYPIPVYAVQVGAFETKGAAEILRRDLESRYGDVSIQTYSTDKIFYRVRVGRSSDIRAAEMLASRLRDDSFDPVVVRVN
jgi:cell division protein FtsN